MRISGSAIGTERGIHAGQRMDSVSRNIQKQIAEAQRKIQELSSNENMTPEEKMKKRQELQQEIMNLNQQLQQHQLQQRKQQQSKASSMDEMLGGKQQTAKEGKQAAGFSQAGMQAIISAGSSLKQAQAQGGVATRMENRARVLKGEIKQDAGKGNIEAKEAELAKLEQKAENASTLQGNTLAGANKALQEAGKTEQKDGRGENKTENRIENKAENRTENKIEKQGTNTESKSKAEPGNRAAASDEAKEAGAVPQATAYAHVDIYL